MPYGTYYKPGDWNVIDDISGFRVKHSQTRKIPGGQTGGLVVDRKRWEPQHPQDFVHGIIDDQTVPEARPRQRNQFTVVATFVTAYSPRLTNWLTVDSVEGFWAYDRVSVMLDNGEPHYAIIFRIVGNQMQIVPRIPWSVGGSLGSPLENTVMDLGPSGFPPFLTDDFGVPITDEDGNLFSIME